MFYNTSRLRMVGELIPADINVVLPTKGSPNTSIRAPFVTVSNSGASWVIVTTSVGRH